MDESSERVWINAQIDAQKKFGQEQEKIKDLNLDLWKTIITIQATILGISIPLMGYLKAKPNCFLVLTWIIEIISIAFGFLLFKIHIDQEFEVSFTNHKFSMDINEIGLMDAQGKFNENQDKRAGMGVAALMDIIPKKKQINMWSDYAKNLADKYRNELPSKRLYKEVRKPRIYQLKEALFEYKLRLVNIFYLFSVVSFATLILSILLK